jgi:5-methylcytosine-specific restriction protein A
MVARFCNEPGCNNVAEHGAFCEPHTADNYRLRRQRLADEHRSNPATRRWYGLKAWRQLRFWKLCQNPICEICERLAATDVHHTEGSWRDTGNWELFMTREKLQALCHECHSRVTAKEAFSQ